MFQVKNQQEFDKLTKKVKIRMAGKGEPKPINDLEYLGIEKLKAKIHRLEKANERLTKENEAYRLIIQHKISQEALLERYPDLKFIKE